MNPTPANSRDSRIASAVRCLIRLPVSKLATVFGETLAFVANSLMVISSRARPARHCAAIIFRPYQNARHRPPKRLARWAVFVASRRKPARKTLAKVARTRNNLMG